MPRPLLMRRVKPIDPDNPCSSPGQVTNRSTSQPSQLDYDSVAGLSHLASVSRLIAVTSNDRPWPHRSDGVYE